MDAPSLPIEKYIKSPDYRPKAEGASQTYVDANRELLLPSPASHFQSFTKLNKITGGFRPYEFSILCGATGTGKTTLCANLSLDLLERDIPQFVASVETGKTDYIKRMISAKAGKDWNTGDPVPLDALKSFHVEHGGIFQKDVMQLSLYEDRFKVETLMSDIAWMVKEHGTKVAFIDNLNFFLEVTSADKSIVEMDRVIHNLIIFCKEFPVHIVMVMHPKKTDHGRVESEFDIKGSSTAVQEAHNIFLFNRPHPDLIKNGIATSKDRELMIAKMRRKGKYVRSRLILECLDGVSYREGTLLEQS